MSNSDPAYRAGGPQRDIGGAVRVFFTTFFLAALLLGASTPSGATTRCPDGLTPVGAGLCTHGPDPTDVSPPQRNGTRVTKGTPLTCDGDGQDGPRVQVVYLRGGAHTKRSTKTTLRIEGWLSDIDAMFTEGARRVRWVTDERCRAIIAKVVAPASALADFQGTIAALREQGYDQHDRIYLVFADATQYCGIGTLTGDDQPGPENASNTGPAYARVDTPCWSAYAATHELLHTLGAVNLSAPNSGGGGHCTDEYDIMCYSDPPTFPAMRIACPDPSDNTRIDCHHDDYFNPSPDPGSYLASFWDTANSRFLTGAP